MEDFSGSVLSHIDTEKSEYKEQRRIHTDINGSRAMITEKDEMPVKKSKATSSLKSQTSKVEDIQEEFMND